MDKNEQDRLNKQMRFIEEIDKEKLIGRQTYLSDASRKENDAEHAWHMAIMAVLLKEYANEKIDVLKTMTMLLIHDIVEIDAGDTYAYDEEAKKTQRERELAAADRIFGLLPNDQAEYMRGLWDEFEERKTPEAKFARTLDNVQPVMLNSASCGKSWQEKGVHLSQILKRNEHTMDGSEELWNYAFDNYIKPNVDAWKIKKRRELYVRNKTGNRKVVQRKERIRFYYRGGWNRLFRPLFPDSDGWFSESFWKRIGTV